MLLQPFRRSVWAGLKPFTYTAFGLFFNGQASRSTSSGTKYMRRDASPTAPREVPTPLVLLSAGQWDESSREGVQGLAAMFSERGYTTLEIDLAPPSADQRPSKTSQALLSYFTQGQTLLAHLSMHQELTSSIDLGCHVRLAAIPFPPVIIARAGACIIAQSYVESNPVSGLILIEPPVSNASLVPGLLPTPIEESKFEPQFPIAVVSSSADKVKDNRIVRDGKQTGWVNVLEVRNIVEIGPLMDIEKWMDSIGV